jgi:hypothetical protein
MPENANPDRRNASASLITPPAGKTSGSLRRILSTSVYWAFWLWLALVQSSNLGELIQYYIYDPETYNRVFRDPGFYFTMVWAWTALFAVAIGFQAVCWRKGRVSLIAVTISAAFACYIIANVTLGIHKICCG